MAKRVTLLSDISGEEGAETLTFSIGEDHFTIDLTNGELAEFTKLNQPYMDAAELLNVGRRAGYNGTNGAVDNPEVIRDWLRANGYTVADKGRIPAVLVAAYQRGITATTQPALTAVPEAAARKR